jgi:hypothetical protein
MIPFATVRIKSLDPWKEETMSKLLEVVGRRIIQVRPPAQPGEDRFFYPSHPPSGIPVLDYPICWEFLEEDEERDEDEEDD